MVERSADWMRQAKRDLENAAYELKGGFYEWACFLAQQAAEKAVKAVFQELSAEAFGHSVAGLLERLPAQLRPPQDLIDMGKELDKVYVAARYSSVHPEGAPCDLYTEAEAKRLIAYAQKIVRYCEDLLSKV